jgi:hypothetical protein
MGCCSVGWQVPQNRRSARAVMTTQQPSPAPETAGGESPTAGGEHPHDFEVQKELHQQIRNDPDYDDWEYGTEPLPHEAWVSPQTPPA